VEQERDDEAADEHPRPLPFDPRASEGGVFTRVLRGARAAVDGLGFVLDHREVRRAVNSAVGGVVLRAFPSALIGGPCALLLLPLLYESMRGNGNHPGGVFLFFVLAPAFFLAATAVFSLCVSVVFSSSSFLGVCRATEQVLVGRPADAHPPEEIDPPALLPMHAAVRLVLAAGGCALAAWLAGRMPDEPAAFLSVVPGAALAAFLTALLVLQCLSYAAHLHGLTLKERVRLVFRHQALLAGFGAVALPCLAMPWTLPALVAAAHRLFLTLAAAGSTPSALLAHERAHLIDLMPRTPRR
jgi:hypothetical protein